MTKDQAAMTNADQSLACLQGMLDNDPACAFLADVLRKLKERPIGDKPAATLNEGFALLGIAVLHYEETIHRPGEIRRTELARQALVHLAATAWRIARDLGIESNSDAIGKDIPF